MSESLNITTICTLDRIKDLYRFIDLAHSCMPRAKIFVALVKKGADDTYMWRMVEDKLARCQHIVVVRSVEFDESDNWGRLIYYDRLKSKLTTIFDLNRMLYVDVDVDVICDLSKVWNEVAIQCRAGATIDPWQDESENEIYSKLHDGDSSPLYQTGFMCIKDPDRMLSKEIGEIFDDLRGFEYLDRSIMPGTLLWNIWLQGQPEGDDRTSTLDRIWHTTFFGRDEIFGTNALHFNGPFKSLRHHCSYAYDIYHGTTIKVAPEVGEYLW